MKYYLLIIFIGISTVAFSQKVDTLRVKETDTLLFNQETRTQYFCGLPLFSKRPEEITVYSLKNPKPNTYYYIYNAKNKLVKEGKYIKNCVFNKQTTKGFCNFKTYYYAKNGQLIGIDYIQDGRSFKFETYYKQQLKHVTFYNKHTGKITKIEEHKNGKLKETLVYKKGKNGYYDIIRIK